MGNSRLLFVGGGLFVVAALGMWYSAARGEPKYELATVERGPIVEEISANGNVEPTSEIDLHFKGSGRLIARTARVGESVAAGDVLARQDVAQLEAQLAEMRAGVDVQRARMEQLLAGASSEDLRLAQTTLQSARDALAKAIQDAYTRADDAVRTKASPVFVDTAYPQLRFVVTDPFDERALESQWFVAENALRAWAASLAQLNGDDPASVAVSSQQHLREVARLLDHIAQALNAYVSGVTPETVEVWKASISTARANVNAAAATLTAASDAFARAEGALALTTAAARPEDRALYEAQIRQAEAGMRRIEAQLEDVSIVAPISGTVTRVRGEVGEIVGPGEPIVSVMPDGDLQVRLNISEGNIVNVAVGQEARITLDAFSAETEWPGTVVEIEPAETVVGGAVYYQAIVTFDMEDSRVRRGMSASVWIKTAENPQALKVPASAVAPREGRYYVRVFANGGAEDREVRVGLSSADGMIEILSGVQEGEQVVLGTRL